MFKHQESMILVAKRIFNDSLDPENIAYIFLA